MLVLLIGKEKKYNKIFRKKNKMILLIYILIFLVFFTKDTYAYLDPGSGNYILQIIVAFFASIFISLKIFWTKITFYYYKLVGKKKNKTKNK